MYNGTQQTDCQIVPSGVSTNLILNPFQNNERAFIGWNTSADGTGDFFSDGQALELTESLTLYALWAETVDGITYTWSDDYSEVTGTYEFQDEADQWCTMTEAVKTAIQDFKAPTEDEDGYCLFVSESFENTVFEDQTTQVILPAQSTIDVLVLPSHLKTIASNAFSDSAFQAVIIPEGCTSIGDQAFANCSRLIYIIIPSQEISISESAFDGCIGYVLFSAQTSVQEE